MIALLLAAALNFPNIEEEKVSLHADILDIETALARTMGFDRSCRDSERSGISMRTAGFSFVVEVNEAKIHHFLRTLSMLSGESSGMKGQSETIGNSGTAFLDERAVNRELANQMQVQFRTRRTEFRSFLVEALLAFVTKQCVKYDSSIYWFETALPRAEDINERVRLTGFLGDIPSFTLTADVDDRGMVRSLELYPGVLDDVKYQPALGFEDAIRLVNERNQIASKLTWPFTDLVLRRENVLAYLTYTDSPELALSRNAGMAPESSSRKAYPMYEIVLPSESENGTRSSYRWRVDSLRGTVFGPFLYLSLGVGGNGLPPVVIIKVEGEQIVGFLASVPEQVQFGSERFLECVPAGKFAGALSVDNHYVRLPFGDYYSPKPIKTTEN